MDEIRTLCIMSAGNQTLDDLADYIVQEHPGLFRRAEIRLIEDHWVQGDDRAFISEILITLNPKYAREDDMLALEEILLAARLMSLEPALTQIASV